MVGSGDDGCVVAVRGRTSSSPKVQVRRVSMKSPPSFPDFEPATSGGRISGAAVYGVLLGFTSTGASTGAGLVSAGATALAEAAAAAGGFSPVGSADCARAS